MKALVATTRTQGDQPDDYNTCQDGELVYLGLTCIERDLLDTCGCGRGFAGMTSHKTTTTAMVVEVDLDFAGFVAALDASLRDAGFQREHDEVTEMADQLTNAVRDWPVGSIVQRWFDKISVRELPRGGSADQDPRPVNDLR